MHIHTPTPTPHTHQVRGVRHDDVKGTEHGGRQRLRLVVVVEREAVAQQSKPLVKLKQLRRDAAAVVLVVVGR